MYSVRKGKKDHVMMLAKLSFDSEAAKIVTILQSHPPKRTLNHLPEMQKGAWFYLVNTMG